MTLAKRVLLARRHAGLSQSALATAVGVQRSAVSHWESGRGVQPSAKRLEGIAMATQVHYEWLATGRGPIGLSEAILMDMIPAVDALLVDDSLELRMLQAFRDAPFQSRLSLVEIAEQLAKPRKK